MKLAPLRIFRDNVRMNGRSASADAMSALLSFTARNVRSYREEVRLSLLATRLSDTDIVREVDAAGASAPVSVLPVAGIFGANASGKSTVLRAMSDMRAIVLGSFVTETIKRECGAIRSCSRTRARVRRTLRST